MLLTQQVMTQCSGFPGRLQAEFRLVAIACFGPLPMSHGRYVSSQLFHERIVHFEVTQLVMLVISLLTNPITSSSAWRTVSPVELACVSICPFFTEIWFLHVGFLDLSAV